MYTEENFVYVDETKKVLKECLNKDITYFKLNTNTDIISSNAFKGCKNLETVIIDHLVDIKENAFPENGLKYLSVDNCYYRDKSFNVTNLKEIMYNNHQHINCCLFYQRNKLTAKNLESIKIVRSIGKQNYSKDGIWYTRISGEPYISLYPPKKTGSIFEIPEGIHIYDEDVFIENPYIEKIIFPESCDNFSDKMINSCPNLKEIEFRNKDITVPEKFAVNCKNLELIIIDDNCKVEMPVKRMNFEDYIFTSAKSIKQINNFYKEKENQER